MEKKFDLDTVNDAVKKGLKRIKEGGERKPKLKEGRLNKFFGRLEPAEPELNDTNIWYPLMTKLYAGIISQQVSLTKYEADVLYLDWD